MAIYLELHPETAEHVAGGVAKNSAADNLSAAPSFAEATAAVTGADARTVRRDAERGEKVIGEVLDLIRGAKLDTGTYLDKLKKLPPNEQVHATKLDLAHMREQERERARDGIARRVSTPLLRPAAPERSAPPAGRLQSDATDHRRFLPRRPRAVLRRLLRQG